MRPFSTIFVVVLFFRRFRQNGRLFLFLRNIHSSIEILKIKILEYSLLRNTFSLLRPLYVFFSCRRRLRCAIWQNGTLLSCFSYKFDSRIFGYEFVSVLVSFFCLNASHQCSHFFLVVLGLPMCPNILMYLSNFL